MTDLSSSALPDYSDPPVIEVALSVQFDALAGYGSVHLGLLWQKFKNEFPDVQERPAVAHTTEQFGLRLGPRISMEAKVLSRPPVPRVWFLNSDGSELVQVQADRLIFNWRKTADNDDYPRYVSVRRKFDLALNNFRDFLRAEGLPDIQPDQGEVTYVNHFRSGSMWERHGQAERVVRLWNASPSDGFLGSPEGVRFAVTYVITEQESELGRLHVAFEPAYHLADNQPILVMTLVARGAPRGEGIEGIGRFFDIGHEWIVRGFTSLTTPEMHKVWGRRDGD